MAILSGYSSAVMCVRRGLSDAITAQLLADSGTVLATARQKIGVGTFLGLYDDEQSSLVAAAASEVFKHYDRRRIRYTLTADSTAYQLTVVAATTSISRSGTPIGQMVPHADAVHIIDGGGTSIAQIKSFDGPEDDNPWRHSILKPTGERLGELALFWTTKPVPNEDDLALLAAVPSKSANGDGSLPYPIGPGVTVRRPAGPDCLRGP